MFFADTIRYKLNRNLPLKMGSGMSSLDVIKFERERICTFLNQKNLDKENIAKLKREFDILGQIDQEIRRKLREDPNNIRLYKNDIELSINRYREDCLRVAQAGDKDTAKLIVTKKKIAEEELNRLKKSNSFTS